MARLLSLLLVVILLPVTALADACGDAAKAQQWSRAETACREPAERGDAFAQYVLGVMYYEGLGVWRNHAKAVKWLRKASEQGLVPAQYVLGRAYLFPAQAGIERNATEAVKWLRKAAEQGDAGAQHLLGLTYDRGVGVRTDHVEAAKWYRLAAGQGHVAAQEGLGTIYSMGGFGVPRDYAEAAKWYRRAGEQRDTFSLRQLGLMYRWGHGVPRDHVMAFMLYDIAATLGVTAAAKDRDDIAKKMTPADIAKAKQLARECVAKNYRGCGF